MPDRNSQPVVQSDTAKTPADSLALSTTSAPVMAANPQRVYAIVTNLDGTIKVALAYGATAVTAKGVVLAAGEKHEIRNYTGVVAAVAASGTPSVAFTEV